MSHVPAANDNAQHKLFRSSAKLSPEEINQLLGVRVEVEVEVPISETYYRRAAYARMFRFSILTLILVTAAIAGSMYQLKIGPFYESKYIATINAGSL